MVLTERFVSCALDDLTPPDVLRAKKPREFAGATDHHRKTVSLHELPELVGCGDLSKLFVQQLCDPGRCPFGQHDAAPTDCVIRHSLFPRRKIVGKIREPFRTQHGQHARLSAFDLRNRLDRKSTRLNSSHLVISYAVFCLKKKKKN